MQHLYEKILAHLNISAYQLEGAIGKNGYSQALKSKNFPTNKQLLKIKAAFPESIALIDAEQKAHEAHKIAEITGGTLATLSEAQNKKAEADGLRHLLEDQPKSYNPKKALGPLKLLEPDEPLPESIPITEDVFAGGREGGFDDLNPQIIGYMQSPELKGCTRVVYQNGDSMEPVFSSGDMLGIEDLPPNSAIMSGYIYALSYERYSVVKRLRKSKKGDAYIRICSDNPNYEEEEIPRSEIVRLAILRVKIPFSKIERFY